MLKDIQKQFKKWIDYLIIEKLSPHTLRAYQHDTLHFLTFLNKHYGTDVDLGHLESLKIQDARAWLSARHMEFHSRSNARAIASVRHFWQFLQKHDALSNDAFLHLKTPQKPQSLPRPLSHDQVQDMLRDLPTVSCEPWVAARNSALVILLYGTGMRISEALSLRQKEVQQSTLTLMGKGRKMRHIPLLDAVRDALQGYLKLCPYKGAETPLFLGVRGKCLHATSAAKVLRDYRRLYGAPEYLTPHALRHTCATHLMQSSKDLRGIQSLLGHASLSSTQIYTDLDMQGLLNTYAAAHPRSNTRKKQS